MEHRANIRHHAGLTIEAGVLVVPDQQRIPVADRAFQSARVEPGIAAPVNGTYALQVAGAAIGIKGQIIHRQVASTAVPRSPRE